MTYEQLYDEMRPVIMNVVAQYKGLRTSRDDLMQEASIHLYKNMEKILNAKSPKNFYARILKNQFNTIYFKERKEGLHGSVEYNTTNEEANILCREDDGESLRNRNIYESIDPYVEQWMEKYRERSRRRYHRIKAEDPEKYAHELETRRKYYRKLKEDPERYAAYREKRNRYERERKLKKKLEAMSL